MDSKIGDSMFKKNIIPLLIVLVLFSSGLSLAIHPEANASGKAAVTPFGTIGGGGGGTTYTYHAYVTLAESGLSSIITSWSGQVDNTASPSLSPGATWCNEVTYTTSTQGGGFTISVCWYPVPGYSKPSTVSITVTSGETVTETGAYSGAPLAPSVSISTQPPSSSLVNQSFNVSASVNYEDVNTDSFSLLLSIQLYNGSTECNTISTASTAGTITYTPQNEGTYIFIAKATNAEGTTSTDSTTDKVSGLNISASKSLGDIGQSITFSAHSPPGVSLTTYQFYVDGSSVQDGSSSQLSYSFSSSASYSIYVVGSNSSIKPIMSSPVSVTISSDPTVTASVSRSTVDVGDSVSFTSTASGGTGTYSYQWYESGTAISGATSSGYNATYSTSGTFSYYVVVTDQASYSVSSSTITVTVNSDPTLTASSNVSVADVSYPIEFSATPSGGTGPYSYSWTIGGTQVSTSQDFSYSFSSAGTYSVDVTVTDSVGSTYSASVSVTINNHPSVSSLTSSQNPTDIGNSVTFSASESGGTGTISFKWEINGGNVGSGSQLAYSFSSQGSFNVTVIVTDQDGQTSSSTITETVYSDPSVTISSSQNPTDIGNSVTFSSSASGGNGVYAYQWYVNGAAVTGATSSTYSTTFTSTGTQEISLKITDGEGNSVTSSTLDETVNSDPAVTASESASSVDQGVNVTFTSSASGGSGTYSYQWYVNGVSVSGATSGTYTTSFTSTGTESIYVIVTDSLGDSSRSNNLSLTVNLVPTVSTSSNQNPTDAGNSVTFTSSLSGGTGPYSYTWTINGIQESTSSSFSYSFSAAGTYSVNLTVKDSDGKTATASISETVNPDPTVTISSSQNPTDVGKNVTFTTSSSGGTGTLTYQWTINGNTYTTSSVALSFTSSGTYSISLSVTDTLGNKGTNTMSQTINPTPSVSVSSSTNDADVGYKIYFNSTPSGGTGPYSYSWTIGGTQVSTSQDFSYSFSSSGSYTVSLTVTDSVSGIATSSTTVTINSNPGVSIASSQNPTDIGNSVTFSASESGGTGSITYNWTVNGVQKVTSSSFVYSFTSAGTWYVNLTVKDSDSHIGTASFQEIVNIDPSISVTSSHNPTDIGVSTEFNSTPSGGTGSYSYVWTVNGIQESTSQDFSYSFSSAGTYSVRLTVTDSTGTNATATLNEVVNPSISIVLQDTYSSVDQGVNDSFSSTVNGGTGPYSYMWSLGGNVINRSQTFHFNWTVTGTYVINLTVTDSLGTSAEGSITVKVIVKPSSTIIGPGSIDISTSEYWQGYASYGTSPYEYYWFINGVNTSSGLYLHYSFPSSGTYNLTLLTMDQQGSKAYSYLSISVVPIPSITVSASNTEDDAGNSIIFNTTLSNGVPFFNYSWTIPGIGYVGHSSSLQYIFSNAGKYNVTVQAIDGDGNIASATITVIINQLPAISISPEYTALDAGMTDAFTSTASGGTGTYSYQWYINGSPANLSSSFSHLFSSPGTYSVRLTVTDSVGEHAYATVIIQVNSDPTVVLSSRENANNEVNQSICFYVTISGGTPLYSYEWSVNGVEVGTSPTYTYVPTTTGTYTISLTVTDLVSQKVQASKTASISEPPSAYISSSSTSVDTGIPLTLCSHVSGGMNPFTYSWAADGSVYVTQNVTLEFSSPGEYTVHLTISDSVQGHAYATYNITVHAPPSISVYSQYRNIDAGVSDSFNSTINAGIGPYNYTWYLSGSIIGYGSSLQYVFSNPGSYILELVAEDSDHLFSYANVTISVISPPEAILQASGLCIDPGMKTTISSTVNGGIGPYNYTWYLSGSIIGYGSSLTYTLTASGSYNFSLLVKDSFGMQATSYQIIEVAPSLSVSIEPSKSSIDAGQGDTFNSTVSGGVGNYNYLWFVNGELVSSQNDLKYLFSSPGTYVINLTVTDSLGISVSHLITVIVHPSLSGHLSVQYLVLDQNITDNITLVPGNGSGSYTYAVFVNDQRVSSSSSFSYFWTQSGTYEIVAYVNDTSGESVRLATSVVVERPLNLLISPSSNSTDAHVQVQFRGILSGGTGPYNYSWLIGGQIYYSSTLNHAFTSPGSYSVKLTVSDTFGMQVQASFNETVFSDPSATLRSLPNPVVSEEEPLSLNISGGMGPYNAQWYFSSGEQISGISIVHAFSTSGPDTFEVQIRDQSGYVDTQNFTLQVMLYVQIATNQTSGLGPFPVQFTSSVLGGSGYSYNWSFGNGHYSLIQNPLCLFPAGNYTVTFHVRSANGALGNASITIHSLPPPVTFSYTSGKNITQVFNFSAKPNWDASGPYNMSWEFPNGQALTGMNISYQFPVYSEFNTVIAVFTYSGGTWTQYLQVRMVPAHPIPIISGLPSELIKGYIIEINGTASVSPDASILSYQWTINGEAYSGQNQYLVFNSTGNYSVKLTVTDSLGASSSTTKTVQVVEAGTNSTIGITCTQTNNGPYTTFTIHVFSPGGISLIEAFLNTQSLPLKQIFLNRTSGTWNLTLYQGSYQPGTFPIKVVVWNNDRQSNSISFSFTVSSQYGQSGFNLISMFGGPFNFWIIILTFAGTIATAYGVTRKGQENFYLTSPAGTTTLVGKPGKPLKVAKTTKRRSKK